MAGEKNVAPLGADVAEKLLDLLSSDDAFRAQFQANPVEALKTIGYVAPAFGAQVGDLSVPFAACSVVQLASPDLISAARQELKATLVKGLAYHTPTFESGTLERRTLK